jgi:thiol-disulfide isomerase/thioredoxin
MRFLKQSQKYGSYLLVIGLLLISNAVTAGIELKGYTINIRIKNCTDSVLFLNHYAGNDISNDDTARINSSGNFIFEGKNNLDQGLYFVSTDNKKKYFDFFITDPQYISFEYNPSDLIHSLSTSDTIENRKYFEILSFLASNSNSTNLRPDDSLTYFLSHGDISAPFLQQIIRKLNGRMTLSEKYVKACISPSDYQHFYEKNKQDKNKSALRIYLDHYFDNLDFSDSRLMNTPVFSQRIDQFIDTISSIPGLPLQVEADRLLSLASADKLTQEFVAWHLISHFKTYYFLPENDALYVHIVKDFLENGKIAWYYPVVQKREEEQARKFEPLLNGRIAPDLEEPDTSGIFHALYSVKSHYALLLFWASSCSHCRDEMPSLIKFYKDFHKEYDLEIFAVSTDTSAVRWKSYVHRHQLPWINVFGRKGRQSYFHLYDVESTPTVFLLDDKKTILAKYLAPDKFGEIIRKREMGNGK